MYSLKSAFVFTLLAVFPFLALGQPSLEETRSLSVPAHSMASDGYGLHAVSVDGNGYVNHHLLDNNGTIISGYSSVIAAGQFPVVTSYGGKLRVAVKTGQQAITLYQSSNGGASWYAVPNMPAINSDVYDIDSYTDAFGTQIVWATGTSGVVEVWHMSRNDEASTWTQPFNVTNLAAQEYGFRPKVAASSTKANVLFVGNAQGQLYSRDLDLGSNQWDNSYALVPDSYSTVSMNAATIDDTVYAFFGQEPALQDDHQYQSFWFTQRHKNSSTWLSPAYVTETTYGLAYNYMRNRMVTTGNTVYFSINCNYNFLIPPGEQLCSLPVVSLWSYSPATGINEEALFNGQSNLQTTDGSSLLLSKWNNGIYAYWAGNPNGYNMRRKPFAITGTIAERTLLTGNNWMTGTVTTYYGNVIDALAGATTYFSDGTTLSVGGTLNAAQNTHFSFAPESQIDVYGQLNAIGTYSQPVAFVQQEGQWNGINVFSYPLASTIQYCEVSGAYIGVNCNDARLNVDHTHFDNCSEAGATVYNTFPKAYFNLSNSSFTNSSSGLMILYSASSAQIVSNTFTENSAYAMYIGGGTALFTDNVVVGNEFGCGAANSATPRFGEMYPDMQGRNRIEENFVGLFAYNAYPFLGLASDEGYSLGGYNCISASTAYHVDARQDAVVTAQLNWWGDYPPNPNMFRKEGNATIDYSAAFLAGILVRK